MSEKQTKQVTPVALSIVGNRVVRLIGGTDAQPNPIGLSWLAGLADGRLEQARKRFITLLITAVTLFILIQGFRAKTFGGKITGEGGLWNFVSALIYFVAGEMALMNALLVPSHKAGTGWRQTLRWFSWIMAGMAFVFFAFDEMLEIHEHLRHAAEQLLPMLNNLFPGHGSRFITGAYLVGGIAFTCLFLRRSLAGKASRLYMIWGFILVGLAVLIDVTSFRPWLSRHTWSVIEECAEVYAGTLFVAAFLSSATSRLLVVLTPLAAINELSEAA